MYIIWLKFAICAGCIFIAGRNLAKYADVIAEKTNISRLFIGFVLVAVATSLPELITGIGSVVFVDSPNLAVGNVLGANSYNLLNIGLLDVLYKGGPLLSAIGVGQILVAGLSLIPLGLALIAIVISKNVFSIWNIGIFSIAILISYFIIIKVIYNSEKKKKVKKELSKKYDNISLKKACFYYALAALAIVASGIWLAYIGKEMSIKLNLGESFIGSLFLGFVTTLPEITVSVAALFIGAKEIAIANMFGSNLFNIAIIFIDDIFYRKAPILKVVSKDNILMACVVMAMTALVIVAMATKAKKKIFGISWYVPLLLAIFLFGAYLSFTMGVK